MFFFIYIIRTMNSDNTYEAVYWENEKLKQDIQDMKQAVKYRDEIIKRLNDIIRLFADNKDPDIKCTKQPKLFTR